MKYNIEFYGEIAHVRFEGDSVSSDTLNCFTNDTLMNFVQKHKKAIWDYSAVNDTTMSAADIDDIVMVSRFQSLVMEDLTLVFLVSSDRASQILQAFAEKLQSTSWKVFVSTDLEHAFHILTA